MVGDQESVDGEVDVSVFSDLLKAEVFYHYT
jgi:hypothetical protein